MSGLWEKLSKSIDYRHSYMETFLDSQIAIQIQVLRRQRRMTQTELARALGTRQSAVSELENVDHGSWTLSTLKKLARVFDVGLVVKFVPFRQMAADAETFSEDELRVPSFEEDGEDGSSLLRGCPVDFLASCC